MWQGEMAFREGLYLAEEPELLKLAGVYVAATGRLHAQADLAGGPIVIPLAGNASDIMDTQDYRCPKPKMCGDAFFVKI